MRIISLSLAISALLTSASFAQQSDIQTETLGAARAFNASALSANDDELGLDLGFGLWQGTSAQRAIELIQAAPIKSEVPIIRDMVRAALLSAGEPPQGPRDSFDEARLRAVMALGDEAALDSLVASNPVLAQSAIFRAERALLQNDEAAACEVSDQITQGRADPMWSRLRIVCHVIRGEVAAAELTRDLLQNSGYKDPNYFALLAIMLRGKTPKSLPPMRAGDDALIEFMRARLSQSPQDSAVDKSNITDSTLTGQARLTALWANLDDISADELTTLMSDIAFDTNDIQGSSSFDFASANANPAPQGTGQLFLLARAANPEALPALLARAPKDAQAALQDIMYDIVPPLSAADMAALDLRKFTQRAIDARDIPTLQSLHRALDGDARQGRLALAADSIGNGFNYGPLGRDIDARLQDDSTKPRARRDAMIALAMGAQMSDAARMALSGYNFTDGRKLSDGDVIILQEAAKSNAYAELVLLSAQLLSGTPSDSSPADSKASDNRPLDAASLAQIIRLLNAAGLPQFAGRIAAQDFISEL